MSNIGSDSEISKISSVPYEAINGPEWYRGLNTKTERMYLSNATNSSYSDDGNIRVFKTYRTKK